MKEVNDLLNRLGELEEAPLIWVNKKVYDTPKEIKKMKKENKKLKQCYCKLNEEYYNMCLKNIEMALEIERLNYIMEDFEQWIEDSKREDFMALGTINKIFFADELLNKIKELKGENNG